ncbi:hypothetical protein MPSEU_000583100 [Mayamaea pseudoterrestris]|nr:hypothetical protein MPSEU_000583100 [Mayamaea pseudoterrestris]
MSADDISYATTMNVIMTWERVKKLGNYQTVVGDIVLDHVLKRDPSMRAVYRLPMDQDPSSHATYGRHAKALVEMVDCAVSFLGPDLEFIQDDLKDLGLRHKSMGVRPEHLPIMQEGILYGIEECLDIRLTNAERDSWNAVFTFLVSCMTRGMEE